MRARQGWGGRFCEPAALAGLGQSL